MSKAKLHKWIAVTHPWSLPVSISPALVAISFVFYLHKTGVVLTVYWMNAILAVLGAMFFHLSGNLISEYYDFVNGVDGEDKKGAARMIVTGDFKPKTVLYYGYVLLLIGVLFGLSLFFRTGMPILYIGLMGMIFTLFYYRFKYVAWGDFVILITFGLLIALGVTYALTRQLIWESMWVSLPVGMLIVAILHANNTRDILQDKEAGIKTQAMKLGLEGSQVLYQTLLLVAYLVIAFNVVAKLLHPITFIVLLSFPMAVKNIKRMRVATIHDLSTIDILDAHTAKLVLAFSLLLSMGNFIAPYLR